MIATRSQASNAPRERLRDRIERVLGIACRDPYTGEDAVVALLVPGPEVSRCQIAGVLTHTISKSHVGQVVAPNGYAAPVRSVGQPAGAVATSDTSAQNCRSDAQAIRMNRVPANQLLTNSDETRVN